MKKVLFLALVLTGICSAQVEQQAAVSSLAVTPTPIFTVTFPPGTGGGFMVVNQETGAVYYCTGTWDLNGTTGVVTDTGKCYQIATFPPSAGANGNTLVSAFLSGEFFVVNTVSGAVLQCAGVNGAWTCAPVASAP
jgi:hypothetical protein